MYSMDWRNHIHSDKLVLLGKPVIKGTRISVELIVELFETGWTEEMILENYPHITGENIKAVFAYIKECMQQELLFPLQKTA
jgi:uncharacterized protein (DUF433 family)